MPAVAPEVIPAAGISPDTDLAAFLERHRAALAEKCASPELVDGFVDAIGHGMAAGLPVTARQAAERHALRRLSEGMPLPQVIRELASLRGAVAELWIQEHSTHIAWPASRVFNAAVDALIAAAADRYVSGRDRTLQALDRISTVAFETRRVDDLLQRLLQVIVEPAASVDTASILLRDGDELVVRAAVGLEEELQGNRFRLKIGEGFAGRIASSRHPRLLVADEITAHAASPVLRGRGLRALYGVPLQMEGQLVGVAHIGSSTVESFSDQDLRLFEAMCARATAAISQHLLQESSNDRLREMETLLQSIPDAVFVSDSRGIHHANRAALDLLGVADVAQLNRSAQTLSEVIVARHPVTREPLSPGERPFARALRGETMTAEIMARHLRTGEDVLLRCSVAPVRSGHQIVGAVGACTDITQRRREDAERDRHYREAKQAVADRQHVLSVVSHDLRNPLNTIMLATETLKDDHVPDEVRTKGLAAMTRAADRMNRMISDLLDVNSIESGHLALRPVPLDPLSIVSEVIELFTPQAAGRSLSIKSEIPSSLPLVRGDRDRLVQVLSNLVSNALKVSAEAVTVRVAERDKEIVFAVIDSGPGIPDGARSRIFEPYWRADNATYKGTGLGLAIVRGIVEGHGGRVWIESAPGCGAAFLFSVPAA
jgi:signal transduction histidine kinase/putative methionine-R-sulfoxide reductase with GAF domain